MVQVVLIYNSSVTSNDSNVNQSTTDVATKSNLLSFVHGGINKRSNQLLVTDNVNQHNLQNVTFDNIDESFTN